jgi:hypothetical protein
MFVLNLKVFICTIILFPVGMHAKAQNQEEHPEQSGQTGQSEQTKRLEQSKQLQQESSKERTEDSDSGIIYWLIERNKVISKEIDKIAESIDIYAANAKFADKHNKTTIKLISSFALREGGEKVYSPQLGVKLNLPNLQEKLQLRFTTYDEDSEERGINENRYKSIQNEKNYGTSLALFQELGDIAVEFRPRLEFTDRFETSYLFKFTSEAKIGEFKIDPEIQLFARSDAGTGQFFSLNFDYQLDQKNQMTLINEEQYTDGDNTLTTNHGIRWNHTHSDSTSQQTRLIFESNNRNTYHLERYVLSSTLTHKLYHNILHYSVTPLLTFEKEKTFHPAAGLDFRVEIIF